MVKIMENPIKIDDLGVHLFLETSIYIELMKGHERINLQVPEQTL